jgi:hypothetical protein
MRSEKAGVTVLSVEIREILRQTRRLVGIELLDLVRRKRSAVKAEIAKVS